MLVKLALFVFLELKDTDRQVPRNSAGASFLLQGFVLRPFLKVGGARIALMRFALLNDASRWTFPFPNFFCCHVPLENLTA